MYTFDPRPLSAGQQPQTHPPLGSTPQALATHLSPTPVTTTHSLPGWSWVMGCNIHSDVGFFNQFNGLYLYNYSNLFPSFRNNVRQFCF